MMTNKLRRTGWLMAVVCLSLAPLPGAAGEGAGARKPHLLATLPESFPTPDGMAIDGEGNLVVACPNFGDPKQPGCLIKIDRSHRVTKWVDVPPLLETGHAYPMGIAFGPDGDLYVCDNQNWPTGNGNEGERNQGRLLRLRIRGNRIEKTTVVAHAISHPNGVRVYRDQLYVTVSMLPKVKREDGLLTSAVYRFRPEDAGVAVSNTLADKNLLVTFVTQNRDCQYGADGLVFDSRGNLLVGNFGDGALHRVTFDQEGRVTGNTVFAKTDFNTPLSDAQFGAKMTQAKMRTTDGICIDAQDNVYVADFSNNAVCRVNPQGQITVLAQSPDGDGSDGGLDQPGEPILWDGKLVVTCFDMVTGPDKVNTKHDRPSTIAYLELPK
jgi:sugar lactone lactonase YvrE